MRIRCFKSLKSLLANVQVIIYRAKYYSVKYISNEKHSGESIRYFKLAYHRHDQLNDLLQLAYGEGIDRIVRLGNALKFDYVWDGYNLIQELSRTVYFER